MLIRGEGCEVDEEVGMNFILMAAEDLPRALLQGSQAPCFN